MKSVLLPADIYTVVNQTILTELDKKNIISLYEPIIGPIAVSLYLTLWSDLDHAELISRDYNHHHLMTILKANIEEIKIARNALESVGLLKSFIKVSENLNEYIYELYSPLSAQEFFNHPILGILLLNNIGENEYNSLKTYYKKINVNKTGFIEITNSINETFTSVNDFSAVTDSIRHQSKIGVNIDNLIDFEVVETSLKGILNAKCLNKKTKELINQLAFIYNYDSFKMTDIIRLSLDNLGNINKDNLRKSARRSYEFDNNGNLPTLIYHTQPNYLKTPSGDKTIRGQAITQFENTKPYEFLRLKNKGKEPTDRELNMLEHIAVDYNLPAGVLNVLIDYAIRSVGSLKRNHLEAIASDWSSKGIKTVPDAMHVIEVMVKKKTSTSPQVSKYEKIKSDVPEWVYKENKKTEVSQEELEELEDMFKEFR